MALPDGMTTCTLTADAMDFGGEGATVTLVVTPVLGGNAQSVTWAATGQGLFNTSLSASAAAPDQARVTVPHVDQAGVIDGKGNDFTMWSYTVQIIASFPTGKKLITKAVQPLVGQDIIDLNSLPDGSITSPTSAPIPAVTSVNGQTGEVTVAGATNQGVADFVTEDGPTKDALSSAYATGVHVATKGAKGDGITDDTAAFNAARLSAALFGGRVYAADGTYLLNNLSVPDRMDLTLSAGATLKLAANAPQLFGFTGTSLKVRGGKIDGNRAAHTTAWPVGFAGPVSSGAEVEFREVEFTGTNKAAIYIQTFGGRVTVEDCKFSDMAQNDGGADGLYSCVLSITDGELGAKGILKFNDNEVIGTLTPDFPGSNPGGLFMACSQNNGDTGNESYLEAHGNHFYGIGQNIGPNDISPIHFYPAWGGCRIYGNVFEECAYSAITAKSVTDFSCTNNVFIGGVINAQNYATEGVIGYVPGYHAGTNAYQRAVIAGNIIDNPGGESAANRQVGINIVGGAQTDGALGSDVVVANNVINDGGPGIRVVNIKDMTITGNQINGGSTAAAGSQHGITFDQVYGEVLLSGNQVKTPNGMSIRGITQVNTARFTLIGNKIVQSAVGYYGVIFRGPEFVKFSGNEISSASIAVNVQADASANKVGWLAWDASNTVVSGTVSLDFANGITKATGQLIDAGSPLGVVTPGEVGTTYRQLDGTGDSIMWVALGTDSGSWVKQLAFSVGDPARNNLLAWAFDPALAGVANDVAPAGVLELVKVRLNGGGSVSKVWWQTATAGGGLVAGQCLIGVYDDAGSLIGQTGDLSAQFASSGIQSAALVTPTADLAPGTEVFVGVLWNGTTAPKFRGFNGTGMGNIGIVALADMRWTTSGTALTALPATLGAQAAATPEPWVGVA